MRIDVHILYDKVVNFLGRNGVFKCCGLFIEETADRVSIKPITSKGDVGRARIDIPLSSLEDVAYQLNKILEEIRERHLIRINGYWIEDGTKFENYFVWEFDDCPDYLDDDQIFFYGLSENAIREAIKYQQPVNGEFIITSYIKESLPF